MDLLRFADHCATEITLIGVVQSSEGKRIETMMRNKKRNNVRKCASCKFIYLSRLHLRLNSCHFEIIEKVLDESSQSFCHLSIFYSYAIHKLFTRIKHTKYRRITFEEHPESIESHGKITCSQLGRFIIQVQW